MSVILIDQFTGTHLGVDTVIGVYFNDVTGAITVDPADARVSYDSYNPERIDGTLLSVFCIGLDKYSLYTSTTKPFAYSEIEEDSAYCEAQPPSCDLAFTSVNTTAETSQGENDGTITAVATSTFTGIEYSLDGVSWQSSGSFTSLPPANYTIRARDSNGCLITRDVNVDQYNNPISGGFGSGLPVVTVSPGNISKWNAAFNPVVINFQRNDNDIYSIADAGSGNIDVTINGLYNSDQIALALSTSVVVVSAKYNFSTPALEVNTVSGRSVLRFFNPFFGTDTGVVFIEQNKPNYSVQVEITSGNTIYSNTVVTGEWSPNLTGFVRADLSSYLQSLVNAEDSFKYDLINWKDINAGASFTIRYRETWDSGQSDWYNAPYPLYVTYTAKQLGDIYGGNMAKYVPFLNEPNPSLLSEFLTDFVTPKVWIGLPWDISFIFSEYLVGTDIKLRTRTLDINGNQVGSTVNDLLLNSDSGYILANDVDRLLIKEGISPVSETDLIQALGVNRLMLPGDPSPDAYYLTLQLYHGDDESPIFVTKEQRLRVESPCDNDPYVYFKWINKLGGKNYWRFNYSVGYAQTVANDQSIRRNVFDWENDKTIQDIVRKSANDQIRFGAKGLTRDEVEGMKSLPQSIRVQMLTRVSPIQWHTVIIQTGSFEVRETRGNLFDVSFLATLPDTNIQHQ